MKLDLLTSLTKPKGGGELTVPQVIRDAEDPQSLLELTEKGLAGDQELHGQLKTLEDTGKQVEQMTAMTRELINANKVAPYVRELAVRCGGSLNNLKEEELLKEGEEWQVKGEGGMLIWHAGEKQLGLVLARVYQLLDETVYRCKIGNGITEIVVKPRHGEEFEVGEVKSGGHSNRSMEPIKFAKLEQIDIEKIASI
jgi:hypothetical protein